MTTTNSEVPASTWIAGARQVVERQTAAQVDGQFLDLFTASMLVQVYDALNPTNQAKFGGLSLIAAVDIGWKTVRRAEGKE